jgi:hypothetical protein
VKHVTFLFEKANDVAAQEGLSSKELSPFLLFYEQIYGRMSVLLR